MPTAVGPFSFSAAFHFSAITSKASSQRHRRELAVLVVLAVLHAQQRRGQPVLAVHDLGQEVALDAVEAAIDLGLRCRRGWRRRWPSLTPTMHAAAGAAEAARRLRPLEPRRPAVDALRRARAAARRRRRRRGGGADCLMNSLRTIGIGNLLVHRVRGCRRTDRPAQPKARRRYAGCSTALDIISSPELASSVTTSLPAGDVAWTIAPGTAAIAAATFKTRRGVE